MAPALLPRQGLEIEGRSNSQRSTFNALCFGALDVRCAWAAQRLFRFVIDVLNALGATVPGGVELPPNFAAVSGQKWIFVVERRGAGRSRRPLRPSCGPRKTLANAYLITNGGTTLTQTETRSSLSSEIH
jgi:hypothetical protein